MPCSARYRHILTVGAAVSLLAAACSAGEAADDPDPPAAQTAETPDASESSESSESSENSESTGSSPTAPERTEADEVVDRFPAGVPAVTVSAGGRRGADATPSADTFSYYGSAYGGADLPFAWLADLSADPMIYLPPAASENTVMSISPDGSLLAVLEEGDALAEPRFDFIDTSSGDVVDSVDHPGGTTWSTLWSPDSRTFYIGAREGARLHRIGGQTASIDPSSGRWQSTRFVGNTSTTELLGCNPALVRVSVTDGSGEGTTTNSGRCFAVAQISEPDGTTSALYLGHSDDSSDGYRLELLRAGSDAEPVQMPDGSLREDTIGDSVAGCGSLAIITVRDGVDPNSRSFLYQSGSGAIVAAPGFNREWCPIVAPDGSRAAYPTTDGPVHVVDFGTGESVDVATSGQPIAFGADGASVLVDGGGSFRVHADGSGGGSAAAQAVPTPGNVRSYCRVGATGLVAMVTGAGLVIYDVERDTAFDIAGAELPQSCTLAEDGRWFLAGPVLVDLESEESWLLPAIGMPDGERVRVDHFAPGQVSDYRFAGPETLVSGRGAH